MHRMQSLIFYNGVSLATAPKFRIPNSEFRIFVEVKDLDKSVFYFLPNSFISGTSISNPIRSSASSRRV